MDSAKKSIIKNKLEFEIRLQQEKIDDLEKITQPISPDRAIGRISRMDAIHNKSINEATLNTVRERLNKMKHALANIDSPEFGLCEICKEEIMPMRLFEMPEATTCTKCGV